jgi:hypothetical protein
LVLYTVGIIGVHEKSLLVVKIIKIELCRII